MPSVSYTHLDVYKRQALAQPGFFVVFLPNTFTFQANRAALGSGCIVSTLEGLKIPPMTPTCLGVSELTKGWIRLTMGLEATQLDVARMQNGDEGGGIGPGRGTTVITRTKTKTKRPSLYRVLILNDDYTPMEFVVHVLERFFLSLIHI